MMRLDKAENNYEQSEQYDEHNCNEGEVYEYREQYDEHNNKHIETFTEGLDFLTTELCLLFNCSWYQ